MSKETEQLDPQNVDIMSMSDDELSQFDVTKFLANAETDNGEPDAGNPEEEPDNQPDPAEVPATDPEDGEQPAEPDPEDPPAPEDAPAEQVTDKPQAKQKKAEPQKEEPAKTDPAPQDAPDYQAFYNSIIGAPIKANGKEITLSTPEDAIQLIQMGANYHQKMAALKPSRRITKMLEQAKLMDEDQIGFLIDLHNKNPQAIAKLVQDSGIDLMDFDAEQGKDYKSKHVAPSDSDMALEETIQDLSHSDGFKEVLQHVTTQWDVASQNQIAANPGLLRILDAQKAAGHFDIIAAEVAKERMLGRLAGVSDIQAYAAAEQQLQAQGKLAAPKKAPTPEVKAPKKADPAVAAAKKAAAAPRPANPANKANEKVENLFSLSDEEFAKIDPTKFN